MQRKGSSRGDAGSLETRGLGKLAFEGFRHIRLHAGIRKIKWNTCGKSELYCSFVHTCSWLIVLPCVLDNNAPLPEVRKKYHLHMTCQLLPKSESMFELGWALRHLSYSCRVLHGCYEVSAALRRGLGSDSSRLANCITIVVKG